jgi:hypothetical protein
METKRRIAMQFIEQHPGEFLRLSLRRGFLFWTAPRNSAWPWISLLAWMGLILALRRKALHAAPYAIVMLMFPLCITSLTPTTPIVIRSSRPFFYSRPMLPLL